MAHAVRNLRQDRRDVAREQPLQAALDESACQPEAWLAAEQSSPSQQAERYERAVRLAEARATLPENQREAVVLRHRHGCTTAAATAGGEATRDGPGAAATVSRRPFSTLGR
jgi:DNA-directed RNA polymerase specialized sigma24 family protein